VASCSQSVVTPAPVPARAWAPLSLPPTKGTTLRRFNFLAGGVAAAAVAVALATAPAGASSTYFQPSGGTPIGTAANCHGTIPFSVIGPAFPGDDNVGSPTDCAQAG